MRHLLASLLPLALAMTATAQCTPQWQPGDPAAAVRGTVNAMVPWDPDGAGPASFQLVAGGAFDAGSTLGASVAIHDGTQWTSLDAPAGVVTRLCVWNGRLVASFRTGNLTNDTLAYLEPNS